MTTYEEASAGETCARKRRSRSRGRRVGKDRRYKSNTTKKVEKLVQDLGNKEDREGVNFGILIKIPQKHYPNMPWVIMKTI